MSILFTPYTLGACTMRNRVVVSPMSQYRAVDGMANDWHFAHLSRFALGGAGLVLAEATAVMRDGRRTHGDLGLWDDAQILPLARIAAFLKAEGTVPGIQLGHAGRKASERRPWHGETPVDDVDIAERDEAPWQAMAPSPLPYADGWAAPAVMTRSDIADVIAAFAAATRRAGEAGFEVIEVYAAHGFLLHQFYSPIANQRSDEWGGSRESRSRLCVEVARAMRTEWPDDLPLIFRLSATDWIDGGWVVEDTIALARALKAVGVDMIDVSTGGIGGQGERARPQRMTLGHGFQAPFAAEVRKGADMPVTTVGMIWDAVEAEAMLVRGDADLIAMGRELLANPNWPLQAMAQLGDDERFAAWPPESGWWLDKRERICGKLGLR